MKEIKLQRNTGQYVQFNEPMTFPKNGEYNILVFEDLSIGDVILPSKLFPGTDGAIVSAEFISDAKYINGGKIFKIRVNQLPIISK